MKKRVFISHSVKDAERAKELVERLVSSTGLKHEEIFCSSDLRTGIREGKPFSQEIAVAFQESTLCIYLVSDNFRKSGNCLMELGWALLPSDKKFHLVETGEKLKRQLPSMVNHLHRNPWSEEMLAQIVKDAPPRTLTIAEQLDLCMRIQENLPLKREQGIMP